MRVPEKLYKYQPYSSYALESLIRQRIWVSNPKDFNDPFDCRVRISEITTVEQINSLYESNIERMKVAYGPENPYVPGEISVSLGPGFEGLDAKQQAEHLASLAEPAIETATSFVGVYSMTSAERELLMWAHYADHHRGFVIAFDTTQMKSAENMEIVAVEYDDEYRLRDASEIIDAEELSDYLKIIASRKGPQWKKEKEWRLVFPYKDRLVPMPMQPVEIIFGHLMQASHRATLHQIVSEKYKDVVFSIAVPTDSEYGLNIDPFAPA